MFSGSPVKEPSPPGSPHRAPSERDNPFLDPSFIHLSTSPLYEPPSRFPNGAPMERDSRLQSLFLHNLLGPQERTLPPGSPHRAPIERNAPFSASTFNYHSEFPVNGTPPPPHAFQWGPYGERCPSPQPSSTHKSPHR